jgi:putative membrane protein
MRFKTFMLIAALGLPSIAAAEDTKTKAADKAQPAKLAPADLAIIAHLHHVNVMEIDLGKLAQKQSSAAAVKKYGEMLVREHGASDKKVLAFAKARGTAVIPEDKPDTEADRKQSQAMMDRMTKLRTLKGADFDREYLSMMVEGHDNELAKTDPSIAAATDPELKKMLEERRTTLQRHADGARELLKTLGEATKPAPPKTMSAPK